MNLYLLRHGEAENHASSDFERALTPRGSDEVLSVAQHFARKGLLLDRCFASPYRRAQQTAALFIPLLSKQPEIESELSLSPDIRASQVLTFLDSIKAENVLLVSHNPLLSELVTTLIKGGNGKMHIVDTSELNAISLEIVAPGMGTHEFSLSPNV